jgi:cysteine desulfuration protein SufE
VFLFLEAEQGRVRIYADVAEEAPTVRGFVGVLVQAFDDGPIADLAAAPSDLLYQIGLEQALSMTRAVGLNAIVWRLRREAARLAAAPAAAPVPS